VMTAEAKRCCARRSANCSRCSTRHVQADPPLHHRQPQGDRLDRPRRHRQGHGPPEEPSGNPDRQPALHDPVPAHVMRQARAPRGRLFITCFPQWRLAPPVTARCSHHAQPDRRDLFRACHVRLRGWHHHRDHSIVDGVGSDP
jgi:hypothetical protein